MWVIRRKSDGWYYCGEEEGFGPDIKDAQTYLAPPAMALHYLWVEEREPWPSAVPVILGLSLAGWVGLYYLVLWVLHHVAP